MKPKLYICKGYPGSGKSTLARKMVTESRSNLVRVNRDDLRKQHPLWQRGKFSKTVEADVVKQRDQLIKDALAAGKNAICDDTNLSVKTVAFLATLAAVSNAEIELIDFTDPESPYYVSLEECIKRDALRDDTVGKDVILRMFYENEVEKVPKPEPVVGPSSWIIDIDGTLAHHKGLRGSFEERYDVDQPDEAVIMIVNSLAKAGQTIIIVSGREGTEKAQELTKAWLKKNKIIYDFFFMRKEGDKRPDNLVKRDIYLQHIKGKFNIVGVIDDRPKVVRLWRSLGLKVLDCGNGIEF